MRHKIVYHRITAFHQRCLSRDSVKNPVIEFSFRRKETCKNNIIYLFNQVTELSPWGISRIISRALRMWDLRNNGTGFYSSLDKSRKTMPLLSSERSLRQDLSRDIDNKNANPALVRSILLGNLKSSICQFLINGLINNFNISISNLFSSVWKRQ